jgi:hypothetical protein
VIRYLPVSSVSILLRQSRISLSCDGIEPELGTSPGGGDFAHAGDPQLCEDPDSDRDDDQDFSTSCGIQLWDDPGGEGDENDDESAAS